jgi:SOS response regulatory protein OraA/RecX
MAARRPNASATSRERNAAVTEIGPVLDAAARFLGVRPRSVAEVRGRLARAGYPAPLVDTVVGRLVELEYLDDESFGRAWIESRDRAHPRGEAALRRELRQKGLESDTIRALLAERAGADSGDGVAVGASSDAGDADPPDLIAARRVLARRAGVLARETDARRRRAKAWALLARHGFDPDVCRDALDAWAAEGAAAEDDE